MSSLLQRRRPQAIADAGASSTAVSYPLPDPPAVTASVTTTAPPVETFTTPRPIRPVATHALAALDRWRQQVRQQRAVVTRATSVSTGPVTAISTAVSETVVPLPVQTSTDAVVVTTSTLPWNDPAYVFDPAHLLQCSGLLQKAALAWREVPQTSAQAERIRELEEQVVALRNEAQQNAKRLQQEQ